MAPDRSRVLLLLPTTSYKAGAFLDAAERLGVEVVVGTDRPKTLASRSPGTTLTVDPSRPEVALATIRDAALRSPFAAVVGVDDETTVLAALAARALGLPHNPVRAVERTRDKSLAREALAAAGRPGPRFERVSLDEDPARIAARVRYPCVLKPLSLSAGRGVIRVDDAPGFLEAHRCIARILADPEVARLKGATGHLIVEDYLPGEEFALEGLLADGVLRVLALFDKPDPLEGPTFEETLLVTPSRQPETVRRKIVEEAERGCAALGLRHGPVHAELRLDRGRPWLVEVGARTIGGLCSRALRFGTGATLEELVLRHATGPGPADAAREPGAAGVMMLPVPRAGILREVRGIDDARRVPHVEEVTISAVRGERLVPLPEGHRYLGFVFARAEAPDRVEAALREAHRRLRFEIQ